MIKLTAVSYNNQASLAPLSAVFSRDGGTLGRSEDNYFVLPDPKNLISRVQASVKSDGTHHTIINLSQANPILLNGAEIDFNREYAFNAGDEIQIGLYVLRAESHLAAIDGDAASGKHAFAHTQAVELHAVPLHAVSEAVEAPKHALAETVRPIPNLAELHRKKSAGKAERSQQAEASGVANPPVSTDHDALMQAFLKGAGIPGISLNAGLTPEFMETMGKLLATSIQGAFQLLAARSSIKREAKADVTMVVVRNNNPLKFLSDSETVLIQMLRKKMPGFMGPTEALQDAFDDLQAHQSGMIAGMNGAIAEVVKRLDPQALKKETKTGFLATLLGRRKGQLWDEYEQLFEAMDRESQQDYQKLFGKAFVKAYEKEVERLHNEAHDA
jgi:FHA domain-containing protein